MDFERETLADALEAAGFAATERSFFSWLGVVPYLTEAAIFSTLGYIAQLPGGSEVVFDYVNPAASVAPASRAANQALAERVAAAGEHFQSYFDTAPLCTKMSTTGFRHVDDIGPEKIAARFYPESERAAPDARRPHHARLDDLSRGIALSADLRRQKFSPLSFASIGSR